MFGHPFSFLPVLEQEYYFLLLCVELLWGPTQYFVDHWEKIYYSAPVALALYFQMSFAIQFWRFASYLLLLNNL